MVKMNHENADGVQLELDLEVSHLSEETVEDREKTRKALFNVVGLETELDNIWDNLTNPPLVKILLEPKTEDDPFYQAQLRARELAALPNLDDMPVLKPGLPFEQEQSKTSRELIGAKTRSELNNSIPPDLLKRRLAFSTFTLTAFKSPSLEVASLEDDMVVIGMFNGFDISVYNNEETIIIPLTDPWIRTPRMLRSVELASVKIPVLSVDDWKRTVPRN